MWCIYLQPAAKKWPEELFAMRGALLGKAEKGIDAGLKEGLWMSERANREGEEEREKALI